MGSKEWLFKELNFSEEELRSNRRGEFSQKRRVMIWFYHKFGMSLNAIENKIKMDRSTIRFAINKISPILKGTAEELLHRYITEYLHENPNFTYHKLEPETEIIKQPDYLHSRVVEKEVVKQPKKPIERISKWKL